MSDAGDRIRNDKDLPYSMQRALGQAADIVGELAGNNLLRAIERDKKSVKDGFPPVAVANELVNDIQLFAHTQKDKAALLGVIGNQKEIANLLDGLNKATNISAGLAKPLDSAVDSFIETPEQRKTRADAASMVQDAPLDRISDAIQVVVQKDLGPKHPGPGRRF